MDGLRGIAVLLVFLVHYRALVAGFLPATSVSLPWFGAAAQVGYTGVDVFFALSGFLIYGGLIQKPLGYGRFLWKRAKRIYPAFLTVLLFYVILSAVFPDQSRIPAGTAAALRYIAENALLLPGVFPITPILTVAWTLSYEIFFYVTVPLLIGVFWMRRWSAQSRFFFLACGIGLFVLAAHYGLHPWIDMMMFGAGMLAFELSRISRTNRFRQTWGEVLAVFLSLGTIWLLTAGVLLPGTIWDPAQLGRYASSILFFALLFVIWNASAPTGWISRVTRSKFLQSMGTVSYSYYLVHGLVLNALRLFLLHHIPTNWSTNFLALAFLPFAFLATVMGTLLLFLFVEYPFSVKSMARAAHAPVVLEPQPLSQDVSISATQEQW